MKFEKLNENKIKITLTKQDLIDRKIDFHVFMSNSFKSQDVLLDMLEEAKKETGFDPENYNLKIEALSMANSNFVFIITKEIPDFKSKFHKKNYTVKRKTISSTSTQAIYAFNTFDDFCLFLEFLHNGNLIFDMSKIASIVLLYEYKSKYYLVLNNINTSVINNLKFYTSITEFAKYISNSKLFACKLKECGNLIIKNNAIKIAAAYFI